MAIAVQCECGKSYQLRDEYAGRQVSCPGCGAVISVAATQSPAGSSGGDPAFELSKFLLKQKHLSISEKYLIGDETGRDILFAERPRHLFRNLLAIFCGLFVAIIPMSIFIGIGTAVKNPAVQAILIAIGLVCFLAAWFFIAITLSKKRHTTLYRDESKQETILTVYQDKKFEFLTATYTVELANGARLGALRKNYLYNLIRRRWQVMAPDGRLLCLVMEDSLILSLLRRFIGPLFGLLRTNFIFAAPDTREVFGEFNRKFTLLDRYVLDMGADRTGRLDRRLALAMGIMLDTGERR